MRGRRWSPGVVAAVGVLLVVAVLLFRIEGATFDWKLFFSTMRRVDRSWLAVSGLLMLLTYVGRALRWEVMLRPLGRKVGIWRLTSDTAIGFMAAVLLGRVAEVVRPYLISLSAGVPFSSQMAAWLLERLLDLLALLLIFGFALTRVPADGLALGPGLKWTLAAGGYLAALVGALCVLLLVVFRNFGEAAGRRILSSLTFLPGKYYSSSKTLLEEFSQGVQATRDPAFLGLLLAYTLLEWLIIASSYVTLLRAFPASRGLTTIDVVVVLGFVGFGSIIQLPGIGGGIQLTSIVVLSQIFGLTLEAASGIAIFIWALTLVTIVPFGLLCAFHRGWNWRKIRQLAFERVPGEEPS